MPYPSRTSARVSPLLYLLPISNPSLSTFSVYAFLVLPSSCTVRLLHFLPYSLQYYRCFLLECLNTHSLFSLRLFYHSRISLCLSIFVSFPYCNSLMTSWLRIYTFHLLYRPIRIPFSFFVNMISMVTEIFTSIFVSLLLNFTFLFLLLLLL